MIIKDNHRLLLKSLVFLFPILAVSVKSAGGVIFFLIVLVGCFKGWPAWKTLETWERRVLVGFVLFCALISISLLGTQDLGTGISKLERYLYFVFFMPAYLLIRRLGVQTGKSLLLGVVVGSFVLLIQAMYQTAVLGQSYATGAYHKIIFGDASIMMAVIASLGLAVVERKYWQYFFLIMAIVAGLSASILSGTRGAWLFLPISILTVLFLYRNDINNTGWVAITVISVVLVVVSFVWLPSTIEMRLKAGAQDIEYYINYPNKVHNTPLGARINLWRDSIEIWRNNPVLGTGIGDFRGEIKKRNADETAYSKRVYGHAHSIYFDALATTGIVGLAGLLYFMLLRPLCCYMFLRCRAENSLQKFYLSGGILVILGFAVFGLSEGWLSRSSMVIQYLMYTLVFMSSFAINKSNSSESAKMSN